MKNLINENIDNIKKIFSIKNIEKIFLILVFILSYTAVVFSLKNDVLVEHDFKDPFFYNFFNIDHGRYIASCFNNLIIEIFPEYLNIHPNDFLQVFVNYLKAFFTILIFAVMAFSGFIFNKKIFDFSISAYIFTYLAIFFTLFNSNVQNYMYNLFCNISENTVFWEYTMSFLLYIIFWSAVSYFYTKQIVPSKKCIIFLAFTAFFLGISIEIFNAVSLFAYILILLCILFDFFKEKSCLKKEIWNKNNYLFYICPIYIFSVVLYYIKPNDHPIFYGNLSFSEYFVNKFSDFIHQYINFYFNERLIVLLIFTILTGVILWFKKYNSDYKKRILQIVLFNIIGFLLLFFCSFVFGYVFSIENLFWCTYYKWVNLYIYSCLFFILLLTGFAIDENDVLAEYSGKIKTTVCLIFLTVFSKFMISGTLNDLKNTNVHKREVREVLYKAEKLALTQKSKEIYLPLEYKDYSFFDSNYKTYWFLFYLYNIHPDMNKEKVLFSDKVNMDIFTEEELKNLRFSNLLKEKRYRIKKNNNYPFMDTEDF